ncbi:high-affinity choline transporter 1 [Biomphalaria pfeifferi]|uniref:High-affinity choline transporter 1 n=1 Tax=Biomphalaria pfeifferi TaxID=112525 RepID=A0AAD8F2B4_BIOPF|nr:high-affinity choline transporter 1 [Biomphalaria pfeifferi]
MHEFLSWFLVLAIILTLAYLSYWGYTKNISSDDLDGFLIANRSLGVFIGACTLTVTWVGGTLHGAAESVQLQDEMGWFLAPVGNSLSGAILASKMRNSGYRCILDPFLWKYGVIMHCLLYIPVLVSEICWLTILLSSLGYAVKILLSISKEWAFLLAALFTSTTTLLGGMYFVAYGGALLFALIFGGLWFSIPFVLADNHVESIFRNTSWIGDIKARKVPTYIDLLCLFIFGGIPWQEYWQCTLSTRSGAIAKLASYFGALGCLTLSIPSVMLGAAAFNADWNHSDYTSATLKQEDHHNALPLVIYYFSPDVVSSIGVVAIAAGAFSSMNTTLLSCGGIFARNIIGLGYYKNYNKKLSQMWLILIMRASILGFSALACGLVFQLDSVYGLWLFNCDIIYTVLFPQLLCAMFIRDTNAYGSIVAFTMSTIIRFLLGEPLLNIEAVINTSWSEDSQTFQFPYRTSCMFLSLTTLVGVSYLSDFLFRKRYISLKYDVYGCCMVEAKESIAVTLFGSKVPELSLETKTASFGESTVDHMHEDYAVKQENLSETSSIIIGFEKFHSTPV